MRVLVTGSRGFVGKNLVVRLGEQPGTEVLQFVRGDSRSALTAMVARADAIVHLAGENRPKDVADFVVVNTGLTKTLCDAIRSSGRRIPLILSSSTQAEQENPYGQSKRSAEQIVEQLTVETGNPVVAYRLPGVFGKWCKPNYNSVVATFCHNIANDLPIQINDPSASLRLVHVDDVATEFLRSLAEMEGGFNWGKVTPEYAISLGDLADQIRTFKNCRTSLITERVGSGLTRALYSTYVSYLPPTRFVYDVPKYGDDRGVFVEMLKTPDCGQFSYFTAHPGITRGGHYHHSKTEKFLVIKGSARFGFRHMMTNETHELFTTGEKPQVVDTVPGWTHDITNVGQDEMVVMLWANEIFDRDLPDTITCKV
jgi:UDP-2-acetamido-2,6-beta-L-arabino-hexul-4-ose reductase